MAITTTIKDRDYVDCAVGITVGTIFLVLSFILRCFEILCINAPLSFMMMLMQHNKVKCSITNNS